MIDLFTIFTKSGLVLFTHQLTILKGDPVNELVRTVLLEGRSGEKAFTIDDYAIKWVLANEIGLVFAAVFHKILAPLYVDELLELVMKTFTDKFALQISDCVGKVDFKGDFETILSRVERRGRRVNRSVKGAESRKSLHLQVKKKPSINSYRNGPKEGDEEEEGENDEDEEADKELIDSREADVEEKLKQMEISRLKLKERSKKKKTSQNGSFSSAAESPRKKEKKKKEKRVWDIHKPLSTEEAQKLDFTVKMPHVDEVKTGTHHMPEQGEKIEIELEDVEDDGDDSSEEAPTSWSLKFTSFLQNISGQKPLTAEDLEPALKEMEKHLVSKNVAVDVARQLVESVKTTLVGEKLGSFTKGVNTAVKEAIALALERVLTPKTSIDIIRLIETKRVTKEPFSIVFIGVNGVGKSTSLAKVCYYLQNNGMKVLLCACDTFRSGAVEQLKVHSKNLNVPLYEQGYAKDPASVAMNGIKHAKENNYDVTLIDTAGRMQNNAPLMRALTKLIALNRPDLVLFVGEALVGNDGVDQLKLFNKALKDYSNSSNPRLIDGMILTKFDTIDDKVGAAVSMVHNTGQPIVFVGTGQKYTNLNKLNVRRVLKALLSK